MIHRTDNFVELVLAFVLAGCAHPPSPLPQSPPPDPVILSPDSTRLLLPLQADTLHWSPSVPVAVLHRLSRPLSDSAALRFRTAVTRVHPTYVPKVVPGPAGHSYLRLELDTTALVRFRDSLMKAESPLHPDWSRLRLELPCEGIPVPRNPDLLPRAPRTYRNGTHRGIDFLAPWGTPVRTVAAGTVLFTYQGYRESAPDWYQALLGAAHRVGMTPDDVYWFRLLGRFVVIDHGEDLLPGWRCISIYAHLSSLRHDLEPGMSLSAGEPIGFSGNSGTEPSTTGSRKRSHLHWELRAQGRGREYYLGETLSREDVPALLDHIFRQP
ncbi:MAG: M23 family metallopeptidase [Candidatus Neomarinimicrobiota bacterium]|nr:MAG: M23 family metallopeptidase [Candidatus Neomarinimicrobiota bacterium]